MIPEKLLRAVEGFGSLPGRVFPVVKGEPLSVTVFRTWFNDQERCAKAFFEGLTGEEMEGTFRSESAQEAVRERYRELEESGFSRLAVWRDVHKRREHLSFTGPRTNFEHWYGSLIRESREAGSLEALVGSFGTAEEAHERMKPWLMVKRVRSINAADGARLLSHHGYVSAEERPLLAAGGLRGAALFLDGVDPGLKISQVEYRYRDEASRRGLEERAAEYLKERFPGMRMEEGENWLCEVFHKGMFPLGRRRG